MVTFDGQIREYPAITIDKFAHREGIKYHFLSHVHTDHLQGLDNPNFYKTVYCSEFTRDVLPDLRTRGNGRRRFAHLRNRLKGWPLMQEQHLTTDEYGILTITLLPANHCPGAVMFLIEGCNGNVLFTGDLRAEDEFVEHSLNILCGKRIDHLYMDTTCCSFGFESFIPKDASLSLLIDYLETLPTDVHVYLDCWTFGYEEIWFAVMDHFETKIHVSEARHRLYCQADDIYDKILTTNGASTHFHSCEWSSTDTCIPDKNRAVCIQPVPHQGSSVVRFSSLTQSLLLSDLPDSPGVARQVLLPFSTHSSLSEISSFIEFVSPVRFSPIVAHGKWVTIAAMKQVLVQFGCRTEHFPVALHSAKKRKISPAPAPRPERSQNSRHATTSSNGSSTSGNLGRVGPSAVARTAGSKASDDSTVTWHGSLECLEAWTAGPTANGGQRTVGRTMDDILTSPMRVIQSMPVNLLTESADESPLAIPLSLPIESSPIATTSAISPRPRPLPCTPPPKVHVKVEKLHIETPDSPIVVNRVKFENCTPPLGAIIEIDDDEYPTASLRRVKHEKTDAHATDAMQPPVERETAVSVTDSVSFPRIVKHEPVEQHDRVTTAPRRRIKREQDDSPRSIASETSPDHPVRVKLEEKHTNANSVDIKRDPGASRASRTPASAPSSAVIIDLSSPVSLLRESPARLPHIAHSYTPEPTNSIICISSTDDDADDHENDLHPAYSNSPTTRFQRQWSLESDDTIDDPILV
ncbi:beta-lactamase-like protein [Gongronella butleri]|nr:beta-lactamase-like protein [Gongronella butleri]